MNIDAAKIRRESLRWYLILALYNARPDWFIGYYSSMHTLSALNGTYPLEDRTIPMAELYLIARCEYPDNQNVAQERVAASLGLLEKAANG